MSATGKRRKPTASPAVDLAPQGIPTNVELKRLLSLTLTRLENWKLEVERNPNPRMVHVLKNIVAQIETLTHITDTKTTYSYKSLSRQMSVLVDEVARLNLSITDALMEDDFIDDDEEERINENLRTMFQAAVQLIRIVQQAFMLRRRGRIEGGEIDGESDRDSRPEGREAQ
ncbi:MAG: hypothetical protein JW820_00270 [Spirochaetales bacterium]|nr:hypothetical protein [Spirochaetales bacterium]